MTLHHVYYKGDWHYDVDYSTDGIDDRALDRMVAEHMGWHVRAVVFEGQSRVEYVLSYANGDPAVYDCIESDMILRLPFSMDNSKNEGYFSAEYGATYGDLSEDNAWARVLRFSVDLQECMREMRVGEGSLCIEYDQNNIGTLVTFRTTEGEPTCGWFTVDDDGLQDTAIMAREVCGVFLKAKDCPHY